MKPVQEDLSGSLILLLILLPFAQESYKPDSGCLCFLFVCFVFVFCFVLFAVRKAFKKSNGPGRDLARQRIEALFTLHSSDCAGKMCLKKLSSPFFHFFFFSQTQHDKF